MKTAIDYPISFPYHGTPYTIYPKHHGTDYGCPTGTPVVVSGKTLGRSGNTGYSTGPHLHVDKATRYPSDSLLYYRNPKGWEDISGTVHFAGEAGSAGNMVVIKSGKYYYRFLHLSKISVKIGDKVDNMYKGKNSKQWYKEYAKTEKYRATWQKRAEKYLADLKKCRSGDAQTMLDKIKSILGGK